MELDIMPFDQALADRLTTALAGKHDLDETRMFGGFGFMWHGNMCCGVHRGYLMLRLGVANYDDLTKRCSALRPMDFTGKVMRGWGMIEGTKCSDEEFELLTRASLAFVQTLPENKAKTPISRKTPQR
jgi:hypothetical protein